MNTVTVKWTVNSPQERLKVIGITTKKDTFDTLISKLTCERVWRRRRDILLLKKKCDNLGTVFDRFSLLSLMILPELLALKNS